jgi:dolichol kinase
MVPMTPSDLLEDRALTLQVHGVLSDIDPARWKDDAAATLRARLHALQDRLKASPRMAQLSAALSAALAELEGPMADARARWLELKQRLQPAYEATAASLRAERVHVPSLRPTNYARNVFHVFSAAIAVVTIELASPVVVLGIALAWAAFCWSCEFGRRRSEAMNRALMRFFAPVAHPHETFRVNSATWYATALLGLALTRDSALCVLAVTVLGVGDPVAALIGKRFGKVKLFHGRSLEGSLAFLVSAWAAAFGLLLAFHGLSPGRALAVAGAGALTGAVAELLSARVDDNLSIPLCAALGGALAMWL